MTLGYLMLAIVPAIVLAISLSHRNRFVRAAGTLLAAGGLLMIVLSIALAHAPCVRRSAHCGAPHARLTDSVCREVGAVPL